MKKQLHHVSASPLPSTTETTRQINRAVAVSTALLTTAEAAAYLNQKPSTLEQHRWQGIGCPFVKIGRSVRYRLTDLEAHVENRVFSSTTEAQAAA